MVCGGVSHPLCFRHVEEALSLLRLDDVGTDKAIYGHVEGACQWCERYAFRQTQPHREIFYGILAGGKRVNCRASMPFVVTCALPMARMFMIF